MKTLFIEELEEEKISYCNSDGYCKNYNFKKEHILKV